MSSEPGAGQNAHSISCDVADHYVEAARFLRADVYDLAIIDLTLPHLSKGEPSYETARDLLREIIESPDIIAPGDLLGITQDPNALAIISTDISAHLMTVIAEGPDGKWLSQLLEKVLYVQRSAKSRYEITSLTYGLDVLVVCALDEEMAPYRDLFELHDTSKDGSAEFGFYDKSQTMRRGIVKAIGRAGPAATASWTQSLLAKYRPRLVLMSGFCGAVRGKAKLGDILILENIFDWDSGKWKHSTSSKEPAAFFARPEPVGIRDTLAHQLARKVVLNGLHDKQAILTAVRRFGDVQLEDIKVEMALAASGSSVIATEELTTKIQLLNEDIAAIDMESYSFYYACKSTLVAKPEMLCIKSACDYADQSKNDNWHHTCAYLSSAAVRSIITHDWEF